jgi:peptidoglycan/xylan/chitin deacetylase (PgdA/CDA1 family)
VSTSSALKRARHHAHEACATAALAQFSLDRAGSQIALTFDDGPDPISTPLILDRLAELGVTATFFLVGRRALERSDVVQRIARDGHAIGSHSDSHPEARTTSIRRLTREYTNGHQNVGKAVGRPVALFRPPRGAVTMKSVIAIRAARLRPWLWTIDTHDYKATASATDIVARAQATRGGDVLLMHDTIATPGAQAAADRSATIAALPEIVSLARQRGLTFVTLPSETRGSLKS